MPKITEIYAWVTIDKDENDEGIIGIKTREGWIPAIGADKERIESLRPAAEATAKATGKTVVLTKFSVREEIESIGYGGNVHVPT